MALTGQRREEAARFWRAFRDEDLDFRPHPRSSVVADVLKHQLLSERRFFAEFLGVPELEPSGILPAERSIKAYSRRMAELAEPRLQFLAARDESWKFFLRISSGDWPPASRIPNV